MNLLIQGPFLGARGPFPTPNPSVGVAVAVPALSLADAGVPTSDGTVGANVTTDISNGTLYWAVLTDGGAATDVQIKSGAGGDIVAGQAGSLSAEGETLLVLPDITGLEAETAYEIVFLQTNSIGSDSAQAEISLTTTA